MRFGRLEDHQETFDLDTGHQMGPLLSEGKRFLLELFRGSRHVAFRTCR